MPPCGGCTTGAPDAEAPTILTLTENLRTIVYAPLYLADTRGYWAGAGLDVRVALSDAPADTADTLLDGRAQVAWGGPMRVMMYHEKDPDCPLVCFGQIVARDPFVLVGREPNRAFRFADLRGRRLAVAREVPTPWMTLQDDLARAGVAREDLRLAADAPMAEAPARLAAGEIDVAQVLEPYATQAIDAGAHLWHRFATRGDIGYTAFYTTRGFLAAAPETCRALLAGLQPALTAINREAPTALADELKGHFPGLEVDTLARVIVGYRESGLWPSSGTALPPSAFVRLKAALLSGGLVSRDMPCDHLVANLEPP